MVIAGQISDIAKKSEFKKVYFCTFYINSCKICQNWISILEFSLEIYSQKLIVLVQKYIFLNSDFFLLCQQFDLLSPSQKYWSCSKSWAHSKFSKLDLNWNLFGDGSIDKFCKTQCYGRKNQLFQDLIFLPGSKFDKLS